MTAAALKPEQRAVLARMVADSLRATGRPDGAWRWPDYGRGPDFASAEIVKDLLARGLIRVADDEARLSPAGQAAWAEIEARRQEEARADARLERSILCKAYNARQRERRQRERRRRAMH